MISLAFSQTVAAKTGWQSMAAMVTPAKVAYSAMPELALWRCVLVRSCSFTRDTSCDRKDVEGSLPKSRPSRAAQMPGNKITPPRRMVLLVSPWHSFEHTQYSTLGFTPKSQNRANVVAGECWLYHTHDKSLSPAPILMSFFMPCSSFSNTMILYRDYYILWKKLLLHSNVQQAQCASLYISARALSNGGVMLALFHRLC